MSAEAFIGRHVLARHLDASHACTHAMAKRFIRQALSQRTG